MPSFFTVPFFVFLLRQFYMTLPFELDDAATIDGCSKFGVFLRILLPLSKPALAAVAIFSFQLHWNDFFYPRIYLFDKASSRWRWTSSSSRATMAPTGANLMAVSLVMLLPVILVYFFAQRISIQGVVYQEFK